MQQQFVITHRYIIFTLDRQNFTDPQQTDTSAIVLHTLFNKLNAERVKSQKRVEK
jgi:hypothetical protein